MAGSSETLTPRQERFLSALLTEPNVAAAAKAAKCPERTAYRWLKDPTFAREYRDARAAAFQQATARMQVAAAEAVETLRSIMKDPTAPCSARVSAGRAIWEGAQKATELEDLAARLAEVESTLAALPSNSTTNGRKAWAH